MDTCPDDIRDPHICAGWGSLTPEIKAIILGGIKANYGHAGVPNTYQSGPAQAPQVQTGMPPPQGEPYGQEGERGRPR